VVAPATDKAVPDECDWNVIVLSRHITLLCAICIHAGTLAASLADYNIVLQLEPHNADALYYRGTVFEKMGHLDEAISDFTAVLRLDPNHIKASYSRGACRNLKGDFASAIGKQEASY